MKLYNDVVDQKTFEVIVNEEQASKKKIPEVQALEF